MPTLSGNASRANTRVYYAMQGLVMGKMGSVDLQESWERSMGATTASTGKLMIMHGVQSVGINTNFNLEQLFELGQLSLYVNQEDVPDVELTSERLMDGYTLMYHAATMDAVNPTLTGRSDSRTDVRMVIGRTTDTAIASGNAAAAELYNSGMYISSIGYNLVTDGNFTESVTLVGNNKKWIADDGDTGSVLLNASSNIVFISGVFGSDSPNTVTGNVIKRQNFVTGSGGLLVGGNPDTAVRYRTVLPSFITNVSTGLSVDSRVATNAGPFTTDAAAGVHVQSISISTDLGRESINQLGTLAPYSRYVNFPVEVNTTIEVIAIAGDNIDALETSISNLSNHEICVVLDDSTVIHLGKKNKVASVSYGGGDATGGNASITYNMSNFNDFVVLHSGDPCRAQSNGSGYWADRFTT